MAAPRRAELITFPDITQLKPSDPIIYPYEQLPAAGEARELLPGLRWLRKGHATHRCDTSRRMHADTDVHAQHVQI